MLPKAFPILLLLLTRDGVLHRVEGDKEAREAAAFAKPRVAAALGGGDIAVAHDGALTLLAGKRQRALPGAFADVRELADGGALKLYALTDGGEVLAIDRKSGKRTALGSGYGHQLAADGAAVFAVRADHVEEVATSRKWPIVGHAIALAAADGKIYVATHEGPLFEIDRASGARRDLGLGEWWGTLALAAGGGKLYAVTEAGKLWEIDPRAGTKTILAMQGWAAALSLSLMR
jgi:hypothetical protein